MSRLVLVACSRRKRGDAGDLPAIERYDGPAFRVLRRFRRRCPTALVTIRVLSAKFGLLAEHERISNYDEPMTHQQAAALLPAVITELRKLHGSELIRDVFVHAGRMYLEAMDGYQELFSAARVVEASGPPGHRLALLHDWLYGAQPQRSAPRPAPGADEAVHFRSQHLILTAAAVQAAARAALPATKGADRFHSYYVVVDGQRVGPKWVVSQATGVPVAKFGTHDAIRLLARLGIEVHRA